MAKTTKAAGASYTPEELSDSDAPQQIRVKRAELGRVDQWQTDGTDSSESSSKHEQSRSRQSKADRPHARTTENPSSVTETDSAVHSTVGGGQLTEQGSPDDDELPPYVEWTVEDLKEECRTRELAVSGNKADLVARLEQDDALVNGVASEED